MKNIPENELRSLISLIDDNDTEVVRQVAEKIVAIGVEAIPILELKWEETPEADIQQRLLEIIQEIQYNSIVGELELWLKSEHRLLIDALIMLTKFQYPGTDKDEIKRAVDEMRQQIWLEMNEGLTALEKIKLLNHFLFRVFKLRVTHVTQSRFDTFYLNNILETRTGNTISLGLFYLMMAQLLNMPVVGVDLPYHFILAYINSNPDEKLSFVEEGEVLFYIDPFEKGVVFSKKELEASLVENKLDVEADFFKTCALEVSLCRYISDLASVYENADDNVKADRLNKIAELFRN